MKKIAIVTGSSGQDGSYLCDFLLKKKYKVIAADRRSSRSNNWRHKFLNINEKLIYEDFDLTDNESIVRLIKKYKPSELYNLAAQSFVGTSFQTPISTSDITGIGVLRVLEAIREYSKKTKFYQASSSEMYGKTMNNSQNEKTIFYPRSPYAVAKVYGHYITQNYREAYNIFACSGILFNHESPLRGEEFVTRKITKQLSEIYKNKRKIMYLGNIDAKRDWGYAKEFVVGMWKMLQNKTPDDYVLATGKVFSVKQFIELTCKELKIKIVWKKSKKNSLVAVNKLNNRVIIKCNSHTDLRPSEVNYLKGDYSKAKRILKWSPKIDLKKLVKIMVQEDLKRIEDKVL